MKAKLARLSLIWAEATPALLGAPPVGRLAALIDRDRYAALFNALLDAPDGDALVSLPWPRTTGSKYPARNTYWDATIVRELRDHARGDSGKLAFRAVIPLKFKSALATVETGDRNFLEGWCYPGGVAASATFWLDGDFDPPALEQKVADMARAPVSVTWPGGKREVLGVDEIVGRSLDRMRAEGFGAVEGGARTGPIRVLTIIRAEHETANHKAEEDEMLAAAASAVGGSPSTLPAPERDVYAFPHGVVVFRPDRFASKMATLHTLGCLHRNLSMGLMHVASLLRAAEILDANVVSSGAPVPPRLELYARAVAGALGRIYGGAGAYASPCIRARIGAPGAKAAVERLRDRLGMPVPLQ